jgi:acyl-coenzyme A thioesterase PaaI-like protein
VSGLDEESLLADGWFRLPVVRYSAALGPTFAKRIDGKMTAALLAQEHLGNDNLGIVHGGAIMTFADMAMGLGVGHAVGGGDTRFAGMFVTAQMAVQFVAAAKVGTLITCVPELVRKTSSMVFMRGLIVADEQVVASCDGIFKMLDPAKFAGMKAG